MEHAHQLNSSQICKYSVLSRPTATITMIFHICIIETCLYMNYFMYYCAFEIVFSGRLLAVVVDDNYIAKTFTCVQSKLISIMSNKYQCDMIDSIFFFS